jgi:AcrR family transcriptional regulator
MGVPMSRILAPQTTRSERTRAALLDAAWRLLEEQGPAAATMTAVAGAAGISRRGLYLHFASRADLLTALVQHVDRALDLEGSLRPILEARDALTALDEWVRHLTTYHARLRSVVEAIDRARATDPDAAAMWEHVMQGWRSGTHLLASRLELEGRLAPGWTVPAAADALWALTVGFNRLWGALVEERGWSREDFRAFLQRLHHATLVG